MTLQTTSCRDGFEAEPEDMSSRSRNYLLLACGTAASLTLGLQAVAPALPVVQETFGIDDFQVGLVTSAYVLPGVLFAIPLGIVADLFGRRRVFASAGILYGLMGIAQSFALDFEWLLIWRLGQGLAFAALMPLTVTIIGDAFTGLAQVRAQAQRQIVMALANLIMPVVGAQLAIAAWFLPFTIQSIAVIPGLLSIVVLDRGSRAEARQGGYVREAWKSVRQRGFPSVLTLGFLRFFARLSIVAYLPLHLTRELDISLTTVGFIMGIATGLGFLSAMITARLSSHFRPSRIVLVALLSIGGGLIAFALLETVALVLVVAVVYALNDGLISVLQSAYAARGAPDRVRAGLVAVNGMARNAGKFVGPLVVGILTTLAGIPFGFAVVGGVTIAAGLVLARGLSELDDVLQTEEAIPEVT